MCLETFTRGDTSTRVGVEVVAPDTISLWLLSSLPKYRHRFCLEIRYSLYHQNVVIVDCWGALNLKYVFFLLYFTYMNRKAFKWHVLLCVATYYFHFTYKKNVSCKRREIFFFTTIFLYFIFSIEREINWNRRHWIYISHIF